ncbi:MAG: S8 family serine peptidase [Armatimonadetes bacterium]|nr:S8 family serine peptidase [Armatimonadota bacterium]
MIRPVTQQAHLHPSRAAGAAAAPVPAEPQESFRSSDFSLERALEATSQQAASLAEKLAQEEHVSGEVLVKLQPGFSAADLTTFAYDYGAKLLRRYEIPAPMLQKFGGDLVQLRLPEGLSVAQAIAAMGLDGRVLCAESNDILHAVVDQPTLSPDPVLSDDLDSKLWGLRNVGQEGGTEGVDCKATLAWNISTGSREGPVVAVIDTGVDYNHADLRNNIWNNPGETPDGSDNDGNGVVDDIHGYNGVNNSGDPMDDNGHGTHVAGTIAAEGNNGDGIVGLNWQAQVMAAKFLADTGSGTTADAIECVLYTTAKGARITSNSWAGDKYNQILCDALGAAPALHICAAGNEGYDNDVRPVYPANYQLPNIISVAAHDNKDRLARFSNRGEKSVHLAAPGVDIYSAKPGGEYQTLSGTSMAAPHVTGVATLIASTYPGASNDDIKRRILSGVDPMPPEFGRRLITGGRLNAYKALENDTAPPAAASDLASSEVSPRQVSLAWTATGDDGTAGKANGYELRYSEFPIVEGAPEPGQLAFDDAAVIRLDQPKDPGSRETVTVKLPPSGRARKFYFALRVVDNVGNRSPLTVTEVDVPPMPVIFEDTMDAPGRLAPEGKWALVDEPGREKVWTDSPEGDYSQGTDASLTSDTISLQGWKNTRLYVDVKNDIEPRHDAFTVEVYGKQWWSTKWRSVAEVDGISDWRNLEVDLSDYDGQDVKVRFRMKSDDSRNRDGAYVDNLVITGEREG